MKSIPDLLNQYSFFDGLPEDTLELIAGCAHNVQFEADQFVTVEGADTDFFYVVLSGKVAIEINTQRKGHLVLETIGPGDLVGVSWLLPPYRWTFDSRAVEATSAIAIDAACLRAKCDADPALGYEMFKRFAGLVRDRLQTARLQLVDVYGSDAH